MLNIIYRYHVRDTGTWGGSRASTVFAPDYRRNWRKFLGGGYFGNPKELEWDPDDASVVTVHRDRFLSRKARNYTSYGGGATGIPGLRRPDFIPDDSRSESIQANNHSITFKSRPHNW